MKQHGERFEYRGNEYMAIRCVDGDGDDICTGCAFLRGGACKYDGPVGDCNVSVTGDNVVFIRVDPRAVEREYTRAELMEAMGLPEYDVLLVDGQVIQ